MPRFFRAAVVLCVVMLGAVAGAQDAAPQRPPAAHVRFAMQGHSLQGPSERHRRSIDLMRDLGIDMVRDECHWSHVERRKGQLEIPANIWQNILYTQARGMQTLLILNYMNDHYDGGMAPHTDEGRKAFARYCEFMARETRGRIRYFEIWNEPNIDGFWPPTANAKDYAALMKEAYAAVKRGNPDAYVLGGSFSGTPMDFLETMLEEGAHGSMDALSLHPYTAPTSPEAGGIWGRMAAARDMTAKYGRPLDIWVTEYGFPTHVGGGVSERTQANMIARSYIRAQTIDWLPSFGWYWFGPDGPDSEWAEDRFGLVRGDWSLKPSYESLRQVIQLLKATDFVESLEAGDGVEAHIFRLQRGHSHGASYRHVTALWSWKDTLQVEVKVGTEEALLVTRSPRPLPMTPREGALLLDLYDEPLYLFTVEKPVVERLAVPVAAFTRETVTVTSRGNQAVALDYSTSGTAVNWLLQPNDPLFYLKSRTGEFSLRAKPNSPRGEFVAAAGLYDGESLFGRLVAKGEIADPLAIRLEPAMATDKPAFHIVVSTQGPPAPLAGRVTLEAAEGVQLDPAMFELAPARGATVTTQTVAVVSEHAPDTVFHVTARAQLEREEVVEARGHFALMPSPRMATPPAIDGDLGDWPKHRAPIRLERREQLTGELRKWDGPEDASARVWTAWDDDWFYLAAEVRDDLISDPVAGFHVYKNDGLEVYFSADARRDRTHYTRADNQYGLFMEQGRAIVYAWSHLSDYSPGARIAINRAPEEGQRLTDEPAAYLVEAAIPMQELGIAPRAGMAIGFNVALNDDDTPDREHPFGQEVQISWTGRRNAWQNPQTFANLVFVGE